MFNLILFVFKLPLLVFFLSCYFLFGALNKVIFFASEPMRKSFAQRNTQICSVLLIKVFNIKIDYQLKSQPRGAFLVCNHLSYLDVLVIASRVPTLFITSLEMKRTPFLGWITDLGECLYVDRKSHKNIKVEIENIEAKLKHGFNVLVFPEATTSNGLELKPFRSSLLKVADQSTLPIYSYCIKFTSLNNNALTEKDVLKLVWNDDKPFLPHVLMLLFQRQIGIKLQEVQKIQAQDFGHRKDLNHYLETSIQKTYKDISPV